MPRLLYDKKIPRAASLGFDADHIETVRNAMHDVVYGPGTAGRARLPLDDVEMAGKTGTAQVVGLNVGDGKNVPWKYRDHGLFVCFAPFDNPRYACSVVVEHGGGSGSAYPIARDVMTYLYDKGKAMEQLTTFEEQWGGTVAERMDRSLARWRAENETTSEAQAKKAADEQAESLARREAEREAAQSQAEPQQDDQ